MDSTTIIQWNNNGILSHMEELQQIIAVHQPNFINIQETRLLPENNNMRNYNIFRKDRKNQNIACGGVAILVNKMNYAEEINLNSNLEAIAIKTYLPDPTTLCNLYLPPNLI